MPPSKPLLIYDGNCGFCKIWIEYWKKLTAGRIDYAPSQEAAADYPQIPRKDFSEAVQLVRTDGSVVKGAEAVFESLGHEKTYQSSRLWAGVSELVYRFVAHHRSLFYHLTRFGFGASIEPATFQKVQWIFLRLLAAIYAIAFGSLLGQITGLIGAHGILPAEEFLSSVGRTFGIARYAAVPTLLWFNADDVVLRSFCIAGIALSVVLFIGRLERLMLLLLFALYLSLSTAGEDFLSFQWDSLLLEAGFLAIFLGRSKAIVWLFRWLVFRLHFMSGCVKLLSKDTAWRDLTALSFHYYTQPLPNVVSWYFEQLPMWFHKLSTALVLGVELLIPFLIFFPRRLRMFAAACLLGLQGMIFLTGNYTFFNLLTAALCIFLFDDRALPAWIRPQLLTFRPMKRLQRALVALLAAFILTLSLTRIYESFVGEAPEPLRTLVRAVGSFEIVNSYGLFAVMTTTRTEIILEASMDGENWVPYEFKFKPGDLKAAPRWAAPYQPRLDWQMWFAALSDYRSNPWFVNFAARMLEGAPEVTRLLARDPFPGRKPQYIRALVYDYKFTNWTERRATGNWWKREPRGVYLPAIGLRRSAQILPVPLSY